MTWSRESCGMAELSTKISGGTTAENTSALKMQEITFQRRKKLKIFSGCMPTDQPMLTLLYNVVGWRTVFKVMFESTMIIYLLLKSSGNVGFCYPTEDLQLR